VQSYRTYAVVRDIAEDDDDEDENESLEVTFIDVGKGLSIAVDGPEEDDTMLIDAGERYRSDNVIETLRNNDIDRIDSLVLTHNHSDHIGGVPDVMDATDIDEVFYSGVVNTGTGAQERLSRALNESDVDHMQIERGDGDELTPSGDSYDVEVLNLQPGETEGIENPSSEQLDRTSIVLRLEYQGQRFLMTSDIRSTDGREGELINLTSVGLDSDIMKASHHGSNRGNSREFLEAVNPSQVVISSRVPSSEDGSPDVEAIQRIDDHTPANITWTGDGEYHGNVTFIIEEGEISTETEFEASSEPEDVKEKLIESQS